MGILKETYTSIHRSKAKFVKISKADFIQGTRAKAIKLVIPEKPRSGVLKGQSKLTVAKKSLKGCNIGENVITGTLKSQKDVIGLRIRYEAASNAVKLLIVHLA